MSEETWVIGCSWHTILDGDLECLECGQEAEFAVALLPTPAWTAPTSDAAVRSRPVKGDVREFVAELVELDGDSWVADIGIFVCGRGNWPLVYADRESPEVRVGDCFVGEGPLSVLGLGVEVGAPCGGIAPRRYDWRIDRIELDARPPVMVERTSLSHNRGTADYLLHCSLLSGPHA